MPQPFSVVDQANPGRDLGHWDNQGNIVVPGSVTANGVVLGAGSGGGGTGTVTSVAAGDTTITIGGTPTIAPTVRVNQANLTAQVATVTAADGTITAGGTTANPTIRVNTIAQSQVTGLSTALTALAPLASPALTGTATAANLTLSGVLLNTVDVITFGATITPNCTTGNDFRCTLTGNVTVAAPTGAVDGQKITFEFIQDATGSRTITLNAIFHFGTTLTSFTPSTGANKRDRLGVIYNATANVFDVVAIAVGF